MPMQLPQTRNLDDFFLFFFFVSPPNYKSLSLGYVWGFWSGIFLLADIHRLSLSHIS